MGRIAVLAQSVADQIAAGEVVERPASVVKELLENALDAGAHEVTLELEAGGTTLIRVSDDGVGMDAEDARLAVSRHATSKIRRAADLIGVQTFGFRGEALAAIGAVSQLELETAAAGPHAEGTRVAVAGGEVKQVSPAARTHGTTVTVRRLFFNTPARRKFLKSARSETRAAIEAVTVLALSRLDVAFKVVSEGRVLLDAPRVASVAERIAALFGRRVAEELVPVDGASGGLSVRGFVQRPADTRPTGRKAYHFVNGRPFRDPFLTRAAEAGYRATINPGCRPTMFLALALPGDQVDVNVHPQKLEVRFRDRFFVEHAVEEAVRAALQPLGAAAVLGVGGGGAPWYRFAPGAPSAGAPAREGAEGGVIPLFAEAPGDAGGVPGAGPVLQVFSTYLVLETREGLSIVDQHSAHERILYERAMRLLQQGGAAAQHLLLPITLDLGPAELEVVETHADLLRAVGFEAEPFGGRSVIIHAVPNPHPRFDARRCFEELVADLARGRFGGWANRLERFAATYACRAAIKAGQSLAEDEMRQLLAQLMACELPPHDVHGRPTIVQLPRDELERRFGRA